MHFLVEKSAIFVSDPVIGVPPHQLQDGRKACSRDLGTM
jgi:hypothetical protein